MRAPPGDRWAPGPCAAGHAAIHPRDGPCHACRHSEYCKWLMEWNIPCPAFLAAAGGEDGVVRLFDLRDGSQAAQFAAADDTGRWWSCGGGIAQRHQWPSLHFPHFPRVQVPAGIKLKHPSSLLAHCCCPCTCSQRHPLPPLPAAAGHGFWAAALPAGASRRCQLSVRQ